MGISEGVQGAKLPDLPRVRRSKFDIVAQLLEIAFDGSTKTALVYRSNLNFKVVQKYVVMLRSKALLDVAEEGGTTIYRTTQKGVAALRAILSASELVSGSNTATDDSPPDLRWRAPLPRVRGAFPQRDAATAGILEPFE